MRAIVVVKAFFPLEMQSKSVGGCDQSDTSPRACLWAWKSGELFDGDDDVVSSVYR